MADPTPVLVFAQALAAANMHERGMLPKVAERLFNQPLAIVPGKLHAILAGIGPRLGLHGVAPAAELRGVIRQDRSDEYQVIEGVAVIPVLGTIVKRNANGVMESSGLVSTEAVQETLLTALEDPRVTAILLQVDSYGGEVAGTADLAAAIFAARGKKPLWAIADEAAYSAAYWIASAAERLILTQNGGVGSIGVVAIHVDESAANAMAGLSVTAVFAGEQKVDLSPYQPLSSRGRETLQAEVDRVWDGFIAATARYRGLAPAAIRGFQAACFQGSDAVAAGLADAVGTFDDTVLELATQPTQVAVAEQLEPAEETDEAEFIEHEEHEDGISARRARGGVMAKEVEAGAGKVIPLAEHQKETAAARLEGQRAERERCTEIDQLAAMGRLPAKDAQALAAELKRDGASVKTAREAFTNAVVDHDERTAGKGEIHGHTAVDTGTSGLILPPDFRAKSFARRARIMQGARGRREEVRA